MFCGEQTLINDMSVTCNHISLHTYNTIINEHCIQFRAKVVVMVTAMAIAMAMLMLVLMLMLMLMLIT